MDRSSGLSPFKTRFTIEPTGKPRRKECSGAKLHEPDSAVSASFVASVATPSAPGFYDKHESPQP
jgi:hypothetical protein